MTRGMVVENAIRRTAIHWSRSSFHLTNDGRTIAPSDGHPIGNAFN